MRQTLFVALIFGTSTLGAYASTWHIGPTRQYTQVSQVSNLVNNGDTIEIDAGTYVDCASWYKNNLLIRGIGGVAYLKDSTCSDKGIFNLFGDNITIENMEFSGALSTSFNGAGVRAQGGSFTIRHCNIHDNQMGVLASMTNRDNVRIEYSVFTHNVSSDQNLFAHNIYINTCDTFTLQYCYVHRADVGHNVKSRAYVNYILYNRIMDETDTASRQIDLPNGGQAFVMGNLVEKGINAQNTNTVAFGLEGMANPGPQNVFVANNTFVNNLTSRGIYFSVPATGMDTLLIVNNIFAGTGVILNGNPREFDTVTNLFTTDIPSVRMVDPTKYNYHITALSPARDMGSMPLMRDGVLLTPQVEYVDTASMKQRPILDRMINDVGAFMYWPINAVDNAKPVASDAFVWDDPLSKQATITIADPLLRNGHVVVYDVLGRVVLKKELSGGTTTNISTSLLSEGMYFVHVEMPFAHRGAWLMLHHRPR